MNQVEQQAISYLVSLDIASLDAAIFRARPRHPEPKADRAWVWAFLMQESVKSEIHLAMKSICAFHNATFFFAPQRSQDGPVVQWLRDMRKGNKAQGAGGDDIDEDMGTDNTKRPKRRLQLRLRYHGQSCLRAGPRNTIGSCMWEVMDLLIGCSSCVQNAFTPGSTTFSDAAQSEEGNAVIGCESLCCRCYIASGEVNVRRQFLFGSAAIWLKVRIPAWRCVSVLW